MNSEKDLGIPGAAKIIIGVERSRHTGWFLLHLNDCLNAVSIRPDEGVVVIAEGVGRGRLPNTRIPFKDVLRLETYEVQIGHNCLSGPINFEDLGDHDRLSIECPFTPVALRLLIGRPDLDCLLVHDLGATPLPLLVPSLRQLPDESFGRWEMRRIDTANDCYEFARRVVEWGREADFCIKQEKERQREREEEQRAAEVPAVAEAYAVAATPEAATLYSRLVDKCNGMDLNDSINYLALLNAHQAVYVWMAFKRGRFRASPAVKRRLKAVKRFSHKHTFPILASVTEEGDFKPRITSEQLYSEIQALQHQNTGLMAQAVELALDYLTDPEEMNMSMQNVGALFQELVSRPINIIDPAKEISEKHYFFSLPRLWHAPEVKQVIADEEIDVCYMEELRFLSLLAEYETQDGEHRYVIIINDGLHPALEAFLLAHELGHWHLHAKPLRDEKFRPVFSFLRSAGKGTTFLEGQADRFAMSLLFPAPYLADQEIFRDEISAVWLYEEYMKGSSDAEPVEPKLQAVMLSYIGEHIARYQEFKNEGKPKFFLEVKFVEKDNLEALLEILRSNGKDRWVQLDKNSEIIDASESCAELFNRPISDIIGAQPTDLIAEEERQLMASRAEQRKNKRKPIYYFTKLINGVQVMVYSFPILEDGEYSGAVATLIPVNELEPPASVDRQGPGVAVLHEGATDRNVAEPAPDSNNLPNHTPRPTF